MLKDIAPKPRNRTTMKARALRRRMSLPEVLLWRELRKRPNGLKFRRQHPTGPYVLDFFCSDARLAIEIDGEAHSAGTRPARDLARDAWLLAAGVETLRIPAAAVLDDLEAVLTWLVAEAAGRLPLHQPAEPAGPPPRGELGED
jgi:very-short-patch-repair endonuclease